MNYPFNFLHTHTRKFIKLVNVDMYLSSQSVLHGSEITAGLGEPWHRWSDTTTRSDSRLHTIFLLRSPDAHNIQHKTYTSSNTCLWSRQRKKKESSSLHSPNFQWNTELDDPASIKRLVQLYRVLNWLFWQKFHKKYLLLLSHPPWHKRLQSCHGPYASQKNCWGLSSMGML